MRKLWSSSIFTKVVIVFLLVITPLYGAGLLFNQLAKTSVMEEISSSMLSRVDYYLGDFEAEIDRMTKLQREFIIDQDLQNLIFASEMMDDYEWTRSVLRIQNKLQALKSSSAYISNVNIHILTLNRTISSDSAISKQLPPAYEEIRVIEEKFADELLFWDNHIVLRLKYPDGVGVKKQPYYVLDVELSQDQISKSLRMSTNYEQSGALIVLPSQEQYVSSHVGRPIVQKLINDFIHADRGTEKRHYFETMDELTYVVMYQYSSMLDLYMAIYVPEQQVLGKLDTYEYGIWIMTVISLLVIFIFAHRIYRVIHKPLKTLISAFSNIERRRFVPVELPRNQDEFRILYERFNSMVDNLNVLIHEVYEQKIRAQSSELKQLQSQMNPHFLYNTYFTLYRLAKIDDRDAVLEFSKYLGEYFQYLTRNASEYVRLEEEVLHTQTYIQIQNIRFSNRIEVDFGELPEEAKHLTVPKLIIQPIVENAFKYALEQKELDGMIRIHFEVEERYIHIIVEDNGEALNEHNIEELKQYLLLYGNDVESTGIRNVHRRLEIMFGPGSGLQLSRSSLGGLCVRMSFARDLDSKGGHGDVSIIDR